MRYYKKVILDLLLLAGMCSCSAERPGDLGVRDGHLKPCPTSPNCVASQEADTRHHIDSIVFAESPAIAWQTLRQILGNRQDTVIIASQDDYLLVEFHTTFFVDDGEFLLNAQNKYIEMRSASRVGYSDLGKNRSRLQEIRSAFAGREKAEM
jgi:uncharacterized protein (DUF1499 family)